MQFKSIIALLSVAAAATASPLVERNDSPPSNVCSNNFTPSCCDSLQKSPLLEALGLDLLVGLTCTTISVIPVGGVNGACSAGQSVTCCESGKQVGLVNFGNVCTGAIA